MKECPNCKELLGDNVSRCFNCGWDFDNPANNGKVLERERKRKTRGDMSRVN